MKKILVVVCVILFLTGCGKTMLVHPSKNNQDLERDKYDCMAVATQMASNLGIAGNMFFISDEMLRCLKYKHGWSEAQ